MASCVQSIAPIAPGKFVVSKKDRKSTIAGVSIM